MTGLLPPTSPAYDTIWSVFLPVASVLFLLEAELQRLGRVDWNTVAAFLAGTAGTVLGTLIAWLLFGAPTLIPVTPTLTAVT
jgi:uncharacterized membrane protein